MTSTRQHSRFLLGVAVSNLALGSVMIALADAARDDAAQPLRNMGIAAVCIGICLSFLMLVLSWRTWRRDGHRASGRGIDPGFGGGRLIARLLPAADRRRWAGMVAAHLAEVPPLQRGAAVRSVLRSTPRLLVDRWLRSVDLLWWLQVRCRRFRVIGWRFGHETPPAERCWTSASDIVMNLRYDGGATPVRTRWSYFTRDPYTMTVAFRVGKHDWVEWSFARDLLREGLRQPTGEGDVRIRPAAHHTVVLELVAPSGHAEFDVAAADVHRVLAATEALVAPGHEDRFIDQTEFSQLLSE